MFNEAKMKMMENRLEFPFVEQRKQHKFLTFLFFFKLGSTQKSIQMMRLR
jgi:hypothetical protein